MAVTDCMRHFSAKLFQITQPRREVIMPVKGIKRVQMNTRRVLTDIAGTQCDSCPFYLVMNAGANHAAVITPLSLVDPHK